MSRSQAPIEDLVHEGPLDLGGNLGDVTPRVPHVFHGFASQLEEGATALDSAASFITRHLSRSDS